MTTRGVGDRWMAGEQVAGVMFAMHDRVVIEAGEHAGATGAVALLVGMQPEPAYIIVLDDGRDARATQSVLRAG